MSSVREGVCGMLTIIVVAVGIARILRHWLLLGLYNGGTPFPESSRIEGDVLVEVREWEGRTCAGRRAILIQTFVGLFSR